MPFARMGRSLTDISHSMSSHVRFGSTSASNAAENGEPPRLDDAETGRFPAAGGVGAQVVGQREAVADVALASTQDRSVGGQLERHAPCLLDASDERFTGGTVL